MQNADQFVVFHLDAQRHALRLACVERAVAAAQELPVVALEERCCAIEVNRGGGVDSDPYSGGRGDRQRPGSFVALQHGGSNPDARRFGQG